MDNHSMDEMTLPDAAERFNIPYQTLVTAVRKGRVVGRKAGKRAWLVTQQAIEDAIRDGKLRLRHRGSDASDK